MARLLLSKSTLTAQRKQLSAYRRFLPSLEMKQQQLIVTVKSCEKTLAEQQQALLGLQQKIADQYPMLANDRIDLDQLVMINTVATQRKNIVGVWIDEIVDIQFDCTPLSILTRPHWVDGIQRLLKQALALEIHKREQQKTLKRLQQELLKVTQRVNLFDKVLIPESLANIRKIQIYLDDKDREAVITSKIAKNKRVAQVSRQGGVL